MKNCQHDQSYLFSDCHQYEHTMNCFMAVSLPLYTARNLESTQIQVQCKNSKVSSHPRLRFFCNFKMYSFLEYPKCPNSKKIKYLRYDLSVKPRCHRMINKLRDKKFTQLGFFPPEFSMSFFFFLL